jgi:hypothetical protein
MRTNVDDFISELDGGLLQEKFGDTLPVTIGAFSA